MNIGSILKRMFVIGAFIAAFLITYGLALLGEPQSIWLMRLIGVM